MNLHSANIEADVLLRYGAVLQETFVCCKREWAPLIIAAADDPVVLLHVAADLLQLPAADIDILLADPIDQGGSAAGWQTAGVTLTRDHFRIDVLI